MTIPEMLKENNELAKVITKPLVDAGMPEAQALAVLKLATDLLVVHLEILEKRTIRLSIPKGGMN